jgi:hypothetical protein
MERGRKDNLRLMGIALIANVVCLVALYPLHMKETFGWRADLELGDFLLGTVWRMERLHLRGNRVTGVMFYSAWPKRLDI